jgi:hypothetical protein
MLTPLPVDLGLVIMGNAQVAFDSVCCRIIGVDPRTVDHIRFASERGFGSMELSDMDITGDVTLAEAQAKAKGFKVGLVRVEKYFEGTNISAYAGPPPEAEHADYCWGGCPGAIEEAIEIARLYDRKLDAKMPRMHVVFGAYDGPIHAKPGEKIVFIGDCAKYDGDVAGKPVQIRSTYRDRSTKDPYEAKHQDTYAKLLEVKRKLWGSDDVIRLEGCPVSVAEQLFLLVELAGAKNPIFSPTDAIKFNKAYIMWKGAVAMKRVTGTPYQVRGPCSRGEAAPEVHVEPSAEE